jgi:hypothetical protein
VIKTSKSNVIINLIFIASLGQKAATQTNKYAENKKRTTTTVLRSNDERKVTQNEDKIAAN